MRKRKEKTLSNRGTVKVAELKGGTLIGGSLGLHILRALNVEILQLPLSHANTLLTQYFEGSHFSQDSEIPRS